MKKLLKLAAVLAALALVFGFASCSDSDDEGDSGDSGTSSQFKSETQNYDLTDLSVTAFSDAKSSDESVATVETTEGSLVLTVTSHKTGSANLTAVVTIEGAQLNGTIPVTVDGEGKITFGEAKTEAIGGGNDEKTTYSWNFNTLNLSSVDFTAAADSGADIDGSDGSVAKVTFSSDYTYKSDPEGLSLMLTNGSGNYNKINITQSAPSFEGASKGAIEPSKLDMVYCELQGPFTAKMIYSANSSSDKTDRTAQIKIGEAVTSGTENLVPAAGAELEATYDGTDTVKVYFGGTNIVRIYDIIITK